MAQTKRKRRTKHRGTAAGTIQTRGRTGRPLSADERKKQTRMEMRERRLNTPPTWKASFLRAALVSPILFIVVVLTSKGSSRVPGALAVMLFSIVLYTPGGYYVELMMYRRRQRRKQQQQAGK